MTTLALEFSSDVRSAALVRDGVPVGRAAEAGGRSTHAFSLIRQVLAEAGVGSDAVQQVAVGLGPGSYTGIRVAIAIAQGWQLARGVRLLGLSSAATMAEQARVAGRRGRVHVLIEAQRGECCHGTFVLDDHGARAVGPLGLVTWADVGQVVAGEPVLGATDVAARLPGVVVMAPDAATLGTLAAVRPEVVAGEKLEPIYLRETTFVKAPPARVIDPGGSVRS